jgi:dihydroxy-acid dehydratase
MSEINGAKRLRSREWFNNPDDPGMTALERYLNYGLTREELQSGKPLMASPGPAGTSGVPRDNH